MIASALSAACADDGDPSTTTQGSSPTQGDAGSTDADTTNDTTSSGDTTAATGSMSSSTSSATTGSGSTASIEDTTAGSDTGGLGLVPCGPEEPSCAPGTFCQMSGCCLVGVCVPEGTPSCDDPDFDMCDGGLSCLQDSCVSDQLGACLPPELVDEICMLQPVGCWTICPVP